MCKCDSARSQRLSHASRLYSNEYTARYSFAVVGCRKNSLSTRPRRRLSDSISDCRSPVFLECDSMMTLFDRRPRPETSSRSCSPPIHPNHVDSQQLQDLHPRQEARRRDQRRGRSLPLSDRPRLPHLRADPPSRLHPHTDLQARGASDSRTRGWSGPRQDAVPLQ